MSFSYQLTIPTSRDYSLPGLIIAASPSILKVGKIVVNSSQMPKLPLPAPLVGSEVNSFTQYTVTQRMPAITRRVIVENDFSPEINARLESLTAELPIGYLALLENDTGRDVCDWNKYLQFFMFS